MASNRLRRLAKEIEDVKQDKFSRVSIIPANNSDDLTHLEGRFEGPPDTPYESGTFAVDIRVPTDYPFRPPQMKFITRIWHPNVSSQTGAICLDTLSSAWSPVLTLKSALISLQGLLASPEPKDPQDAEVASMLIKNPKEFNHVAAEWAVKYAGAKPKEGADTSGGATPEQLKQKARDLQAKQKQDAERERREQYHGYNEHLISRFVQMGFSVRDVVSAFEFVGIDKNDGEDYELEEEYMGDITARLFGEP